MERSSFRQFPVCLPFSCLYSTVIVSEKINKSYKKTGSGFGSCFRSVTFLVSARSHHGTGDRGDLLAVDCDITAGE